MVKIKRSNQIQNITAFIFDKKGRILSIGKNNYKKTHTKMYLLTKEAKRDHLNTIYLHAEIDAILKCRNLDLAYRILVIRIRSNGKKGLAKPCPICETGISKTNIKILEYSDNNEEIVRI